MFVSHQLGVFENDSEVNFSLVERLFDKFVSLNIPYETISNLRDNVLIKTPGQMIECIESGMGGHCVEHALVLCEVFKEHGMDAIYVNADNIDHIANVTTLLSKPYIMLKINGEDLLVDAYYRRMIFKVPKEGKIEMERFTIDRIDDVTVKISFFGRKGMYSEEIIYFKSGIKEKIKIFDDRYKFFTPFGITAPYYQEISPQRKGIYFDVERDSLVLQENKEVKYVSEMELSFVDWIPDYIKSGILSYVLRNKSEKSEVREFLESGEYTPIYKILEKSNQGHRNDIE